MKKIILTALCITAIISCIALLTACDTGCITAHKDANKDGICEECGRDISETQLAPKDYLQYVDGENEKNFSEAQKNDALSNMTVHSGTLNSLLVQFNNSSAAPGEMKTAFLNTETGEIVFKLNMEAEDAKIVSTAQLSDPNAEAPFIMVNSVDNTKETPKYKTALYSYLGKEIAVATSAKGFAEAPMKYNADLWLFDGKIYKYKDGVAKYLLDKGLAQIPSIDYASDTYFYRIEESGAYVYDSTLKLVTGYEAPSNSIKSSFFVLGDGNIFAQNIIYLPNEAEEYDLVLNGLKCGLESLVIDAKSGKIESEDLDFYVYELSNIITNPDLKNEIIKYDVLANVAYISRIENYALSTNEELVNLSDEFVLINYLAHEVPMQDGIATPISADRYIVKDKSGKKYLVDGKGELVGEVTDATYIAKTGLFLYDGSYYDMDLKLVMDIDEMGYELVEHCYPGGLSYLEPIYSVYRKKAEGNEEYSYFVLKDGKMCQLAENGTPTRFFVDRNNSSYFYYDYIAQDEQVYRAFCDFDGKELFKVQISAEAFVDVTATALTEGECLLFEHTYRGEDGVSVKDFYLSISKKTEESKKK
ncbi:MAG: hypothetical protein E7596_02990 [Ruminococcaceae bacterium]|nr:hypothetical protein [Oscillospiraceae bacterium]